MIVLIVGGKLQGTEAVYLAKKAGYETWLVDRNPNALAVHLCDRYFCVDAMKKSTMLQLFRNVDFVIPGIENQKVLKALTHYSNIATTPIAFDAAAYAVSASKRRSNAFFAKHNIPIPKAYPEGAYPLIAKPSDRSGSEGVRLIHSPEELAIHPEYLNKDYILQEYLPGRSFSIEVIGDGDMYNILQITEIIVDDVYDCKQVVAPARISQSMRRTFEKIAVDLAEALRIHGIFDIEVIEHQGQIKVLEIDARLPSQTPISVYHSTGINMVELLADVAFQCVHSVAVETKCVCLLQQVEVAPDDVVLLGEHIMATAGPMNLIEGFFGADEGITNYATGKTHWQATLIITADSEHQARLRLATVLKNIREHQKKTAFQEAIG